MKHPVRHQRWSEKQIRELLSIREKNNYPIVEFCKIYKIHKATYYNWRNKYGIQKKAASQFIPVQLQQNELVPVLFSEIEFSSKATVRLYQQVDASWIKTLLK